MVKRRKPQGCGFTAAINDETDRGRILTSRVQALPPGRIV